MSSPRRVVVRLRAGSDGDPAHIPRSGTHEELDPPTLYLEKIGDQWMQARGEAQPRVRYILESLPAGYTLWQRPRPKDSKHFDKYLYGHPDGKIFDSPNRFYPHFQHLMDNGDSIGCPCTVCSGSSGVLPRSTPTSTKARSSSGTVSNASLRPGSSQSSSHPFPVPTEARPVLPTRPESASPASHFAAQPPIAHVAASSTQYRGRPKLIGAGMDTSRIDEEGTPDVYRNLIIKLRKQDTVDETIEEPFSMDWRTEQELLPELLQKVKENPQWAPRIGEIVLYVRELSEGVHILRHPLTEDYLMYEEATNQWLDRPVWEAGLVAQLPTEPITINDICENGIKEGNVTYFGVRIEPLPDVNSTDKALSKRHRYIPVRHIRPFVLWKQLLHRVSECHPTVLNAQTIAATMSLTGKYRFKGVWPDASIYCRAMHLGFEMVAVGDAVRLLPNASKGQTSSTDILIIKSIRLKWTHLDNASDNDWDEGRPYNSAVWIYGAAFTNDPARLNKEWLSEALPPKATDDYGEWYPLHPLSKELAVPFSRVIGRLHERDAVALWLNIKAKDYDFLDAGRETLIESRAFSRQHDIRISSHPDATWFWADSRAQALDLHTINSLDVSVHDPLRDPKDWRKKIKIVEGMTNNKVVPTAKRTGVSGAPGRNLRGFMAPALSDSTARLQLSTALDTTTVGDSATGSSSTSESSATGASRKRSVHVINLDSDEEDSHGDEINEEIRHATRIIEDAPAVPVKKTRVTVSVGRRREA